MTEETDWKRLTYELVGAVYFALNHLKAQGTGMVINIETGHSETWQRYFAGYLAKVPDIEIDWKAIDALALPYRKRQAYFKKKKQEQPSRESV